MFLFGFFLVLLYNFEFFLISRAYNVSFALNLDTATDRSVKTVTKRIINKLIFNFKLICLHT